MKYREVWPEILSRSSDHLAHQLWCAVIREIAEAVVKQERIADEDGSAAEDLIDDWQDEALPGSADLAFVLGNFEYFSEMGLSWDEKMSLAGDACGYAYDAVWDLHNLLDGIPAAQEVVTEESVEDFYQEWRKQFLLRVLQEAEGLAKHKPRD